ncbi:13368_t:CDS:2, partial [Entrophospora sp. SA101]
TTATASTTTAATITTTTTTLTTRTTAKLYYSTFRRKIQYGITLAERMVWYGM